MSLSLPTTLLSPRQIPRWLPAIGKSLAIKPSYLLLQVQNASSSTSQSFKKSVSCQTPTTTSSSSDGHRKEEKAQIIKTLFHNYGFTQTHISKFSRVCPLIFELHPDKNLQPKIDFFRSIGVADTDLPRILTANSVLLLSSLAKKLIPNFNFLKDFLGSDELALKSFYRCRRILACDMKRIVSPNVEHLRQVGVPHRFIARLLLFRPDSLFRDPDKFKASVDEVIKMGFDPDKLAFVLAVQVFCKIPKRTVDQKMEVYRRFGLSDDEIWDLFKSRPTCMAHSDEKIVKVMNFLVHEMKRPPTVVVLTPAVLTLDVEKRIIPRCRVVQLLIDEKLVKKSISMSSTLLTSEDKFLDRFVYRHENELPGLMKCYRDGVLQLGKE